jgi:hypothetical protein
MFPPPESMVHQHHRELIEQTERERKLKQAYPPHNLLRRLILIAASLLVGLGLKLISGSQSNISIHIFLP